MGPSLQKSDTIRLDLVARDEACLWHPYTQAKDAPPPLIIERAEGSLLYEADGRCFIDAASSWWTNLHGHGHPSIVEAISEQARVLDHVIFAGCSHFQAIRLAERLIELFKGAYARVFYSDNGSTAVEVAIKMALQWQQKSGKIIGFKGGYHGDTFGAMAVAKSYFNQPFWPFLFDVVFIDPPLPGREKESLRQLEKELEEETLLFIFEPHIQAAGGMVVHNLETLDKMIGLAKANGALTIADEVMTGFGRTGPLFVTDELLNKPDFICLAKGLSGGVLPLAATLTTERIFDGFKADELQKAFLHGHTYAANPIACAAANASLDLLETSLPKRKRINKAFVELQKTIEGDPFVKRVEVLGPLFILEYVQESGYFSPFKEKLFSFFLEHGILTRPIGNFLYLMPPYCLTDEELNHLCNTVQESLDALRFS